MDDDDGVLFMHDAKILAIEMIEPRADWMRPLGHRYRPDLFTSGSTDAGWTYEKAMRRFRGLSVHGGGHSEEEPPDIDAVIALSSDDELMYSQTSETLFTSRRSVIGIRARCRVEYTPARGDKRQRTRATATVLAEWPIICDLVRYSITAVLVGVGYDATASGCSVVPIARTRASVQDFIRLLVGAADYHANAAATCVRRLFPSIYGDAADPALHVCATLLPPETPTVPVQPGQYTFEIAELRAIIDAGRGIGWPVVDSSKAVFQTVAAFFHSEELARVAQAYPARRAWFDVLARGRHCLLYVDELLARAPHILCIRTLKHAECKRKQAEIKARRVEVDHRCAAVRGLLVLPERTFLQYHESVRSNQDPVVVTAIDLYTLMQHDQGTRPEYYINAAHERRIMASEHGATSGHMFTVIDSTPRARLDDCDSAGALGAVTLDTWPLASLLPTLPRSPQDQRAITIDFADTIQRLAVACTPERLVESMRWLISNEVVVRVPMVGSGPTNAGKHFDAFYLASTHADQSKCVAILRDMYERGLAATFRPLPSPAAHAEQVRKFRQQCAYMTRARELARTLGNRHADVLARRRTDAPEILVGEPSEQAPVTPEELLQMARTLHADVVAYMAQPGAAVDPDDPYAALMPLLRAGERAQAFGLLKNPTPEADDGQIDLIDEQLRAIERSLVSPISIVTGRAGTGKTEVLRKIVAPYPPEQVMVTAFTGKVVSELTRRVLPARTTHSLLFSEALYGQEARRITAMQQSLATRNDSDPTLAQISELRAALFRLLGPTDHQSPFEGIRVLIIDEVSMMPFSMFKALLAAVHDAQRRTGRFLCRLILCGDPWQLSPIGFGSVLTDMMHAFPWCVHHLTVNHRSEGNATFAFANDVALRRLGTPGHPWPQFGGAVNEQRLLTSTRPTFEPGDTLEQQEEKRRIADDASLVFMPASNETLPRVIHDVLDLLGALEPSARALRESILMLATTRAVVGRVNDIVRALFARTAIELAGGEVQASSTGELLLPPTFKSRILPAEPLILKKNRREIYTVECADDDEDMLASRAGLPSPELARLESAARHCQLVTSSISRRVDVAFYNGQLLRVVGFYDAPRIIKASTRCRCGLAPPVPAGQTPPKHDCVVRLHEVPLGRRVPTNMNDPTAIKYHTQDMLFQNGAWTHRDRTMRRMAVFELANEPGKFKEVDVASYLGSQSQYAFVYGATIHVIQGSEAPTIFLIATQDVEHFGNRAFYTGLTRSRLRVIVIGDPRAFQNTIRRREANRRSAMFHLLGVEAIAVHNTYADRWALADALKIDDPDMRPLLDARRTAPTAAEMWLDYERVQAAALSE